jgi:hypothetical protein
MAKTRAKAATASTLMEIYFIVFILVIVFKFRDSPLPDYLLLTT